MRTIGLFFGLLLLWWAVNTWLLWQGVHATLTDLRFALAFTLFFGSLTAVPAVGYLIGADALAGRLSFPWNVLAFIVLTALGCALYAAVLRYWKGNPLPTMDDGWYWYLYRLQLIPSLIVAAVLLVKQMSRVARRM
jgi:hypothetical protein